MNNVMSRIAIITDSDASLPAELAAQHNIVQVPIAVHFGDQSYESDLELTNAELFARVDRDGILPTTSAPGPGQFAQAFQRAFDAGAEQVICFCVSGEVSATYNSAVTARELTPEQDITVVDTRQLSLSQGFMALAAAEAGAAGATKDEILALTTNLGERIHLFAALSTLKYLAMSGRVGHLAAGMAGLLNIKPILTVRDGKLDLLEKVRTQKKAWARVIELARETLGDQPAERMAILHVNAPAEARQFQQQLCAAIPCPAEIMTGELNSGLSVHSGAGLVGVVIVRQAKS